MPKLGFIGAGHVVKALIAGFLGGKTLESADIGVYDLFPAQTEPFAANGHPVFESVQALTAACEYVFLTVKPQTVEQVLPLVKESIGEHTVIVSVAAGVRAEKIQAALGAGCKIVLCIPNTPIALGYGATALARTDVVGDSVFGYLRGLFESCGSVEELPMDKMAEVIPINSSSPAFVYRMAEVVSDEAAAMGIDKDMAVRLFCQTLIGSAQMLLQSGTSPRELVEQVATPGGTTEAALNIMQVNGYDHSLQEGIRVCAQRAREIGG